VTGCLELCFVLHNLVFYPFSFLSFSVSPLVSLFLPLISSYSILSFFLSLFPLAFLFTFISIFLFFLFAFFLSFTSFSVYVSSFLYFIYSSLRFPIWFFRRSFCLFISVLFYSSFWSFIALSAALLNSSFLLSEIKESYLLVSAPKISSGSLLLVPTRH
jgi:hypothetical protein